VEKKVAGNYFQKNLAFLPRAPLLRGLGLEVTKMLHHMSFDEIVAACDGATKQEKANFYHTWWGWISKGVLHVCSTSGAASRKIWHFDVRQNFGSRMFFKNTTGVAYCYIRPGAQNHLEEVVFKLNPHARIEYVTTLDGVEMLTRGSGCNHQIDNRKKWFSFLTDGGRLLKYEADKVIGLTTNESHHGCPTESDVWTLNGGSYALQFEVNTRSLQRVLVTPNTSQEMVVEVIRVEGMLLSIAPYEDWRRSEEQNLFLNDSLRRIIAGCWPIGKGQKKWIIRLTEYPSGQACKGIDQSLLDEARKKLA